MAGEGRAPAARAGPERGRPGPHNLPFELTRFVGRAGEVAKVATALEASRLVTLTGPGGCGKTRLATRTGLEVLGRFPDGCLLVDLAATTDAALVAQLVAQVLGVRELPGTPVLDAVVASARGRRLLLLLDNCEHLVDPVAGVVRELLATCPDLRVLATSRRPLGLPGEVVWRVPPLDHADAVRLFLERARDRMPSFSLTPATTQAVTEICNGLDGLPLAIELATARVSVLAVDEIADMLSDQLALLAGGDRAADPRHRSLEAALRWSYDLLDDPQRSFFERLAVYSGWWGRDVATATAPDGHAPLELLVALVDQSLVLAETAVGGPTRYRMLEPVRQFGLARLAANDGEAAAHEAHATFVLDLAERAAAHLRGPEQLGWLRRLDDAEPDLRAATGRLTRADDGERLAALGWSLWLFWWLRGRFTEGRRAMEHALATPLPPHARARAAFVAGTMACGQADYPAAAELLDESLGLFLAAGDNAGAAYTLSSAGFAAIGRGRHGQGVEFLERGVVLALAAGDGWAASFMSCFLGTVARGAGQLDRAAEMGRRALDLARGAGDREGAAMASHLLAGVARDTGRDEEAALHFREGLRLAAQVGDAPNVAFCLQGLAAVDADPARAVRFFAAAAALLARADSRGYVSAPDQGAVEAELAAARTALGVPAFTQAWQAGHDMAPSEMLAVALDERPAAPVADPDGLTSREAQVLDLIAAGRANKQIATAMSISVSTVEQHVTRLYAKIGARGRAEATVHALRRGVRPTEPRT